MDIILIVLAILFLLLAVILFFPVPLTFKFRWNNKKSKGEIKLFGKVITKDKGKKKNNLPSLKKIITFIFSEDSGIFKSIKYLFQKSYVNNFKLFVTVAGDDAAATAITYGSVCSIIYPAIAYLESIITFKKDDIKVNCDFGKESSDLFFYAQLKVKVITALIILAKVLPKFIKLSKEVNSNE